MPDVAAAVALCIPGLYPSLAGYVRRALTGLGIGSADVEDLTQDVFVTLHRRRIAFQSQRAARAWLYGTARRVASNHRRAQSRMQRRLLHAPVPAATPSPEDVVDGRRAAARLDRFSSGLAPDVRAVFQMSELHGMSGPAISERLGIPLNTTYSHLRRARCRLRALGLVALAIALLAVSLLAGTCTSEGADEHVRVAVRGGADTPG